MGRKLKFESLVRVPGLGARVWGTAIAVCVVGFLLVMPWIPPPLPKVVRMGTGAPDGAYQKYGEMLQGWLADQGIVLELVPSSGSVENVTRLLDDENPIDLALVQSGCMTADEKKQLESVASLFYEPCLVFHRKEVDLHARDFSDLRIAVGVPGSGTFQLLSLLLEKEETAELIPIGGSEAAEALKRGEVDAAAFVTTFDVEWLGSLFEDPQLNLLTFQLADAMTRRHRYLNVLKIPRGLYDLHRRLPPEDATVVATTTSLVMRPGTHTGLIPLLIESCRSELAGGSIFAEPGVFPSPHQVEAPLAEDAARYFRRGPTFLHRYLPFRLAHFFGRMMILILPFLTLLYPLFKSAGPIYRWLVMRRIYRWYRVLRALEMEMDRIEDEEHRRRIERDLDRIANEIRGVSVPIRYAADLYQLRYHRRMLTDRLRGLEDAGPNTGAGQ